MKYYAAILLLMIAIGVGLAVRVSNQEQRLDQTVFLQTTESIRNLQALDKNFLIQLHQSRLKTGFDHAVLNDTNYQLSEEFDNLRYEALFEEIEASVGLSEAVAQFEAQFLQREELLERFVSQNTISSNSLFEINKTAELVNEHATNSDVKEVQQLLTATNNLIYRTAIGTNEGNAKISSLLEEIAELQFSLPTEIATKLGAYKESVSNFLDSHDTSTAAYKKLNRLQSGPLLDEIEDQYTAYHNQAIGGSNQLRNALVIYGIALLLALLLFAYKIRKNYISLEQQVADRTKEIETAYLQLQESQEQLIQSEKMASLGQMVAGVAHEINTPLGYVSSNVETIGLNLKDLQEVLTSFDLVHAEARSKDRNSKRLTAKLVNTLKLYEETDASVAMDECQQLLDDGSFGLTEIATLVNSLRDFSRLDRQSTEQIDLHECIENALTIASNHIKENKVHIVREFNEIPTTACIPSKLNQLFLNIITNACQAMSTEPGELTIFTEHVDNEITLRFQDQGTGMDEATLQKIFDPFFTTKEIGKGTGLGMSIAYKIVASHNGSISASSEVGLGTQITITLPVQQNMQIEQDQADDVIT